MNVHVRQKKDMNDMIAAMEQEFADAENELRQEFEAQREEIKNRNSEEYNVLKVRAVSWLSLARLFKRLPPCPSDL